MKETAMVALVGLLMCFADAFPMPAIHSTRGVARQQRADSTITLRGQHSNAPKFRFWTGNQVTVPNFVCGGRGHRTHSRMRGIVSSTSDAETAPPQPTDSVWFRLYIDGVEKGGLTKTKVGAGVDITDIARSIKAECSTFLTNIDASSLRLYAHNSDEAPLDPTFLWNVLSHGGDASRPMVVKAPATCTPSGTTIVPVVQVAKVETASKALLDQGYSKGLIEAMMNNQQIFAQCIWIVDNSGSMIATDGRRTILGRTSESPIECMECSRWTEMQQTVEYHAEMAALLQSPTTFRLLNDPGRFCGPQIFSIASNDSKGKSIIENELSVALSTMQKSKPGGVTPLTRHVKAIRTQVVSMLPQLQEDGTKVAIVIATDGLPSDMLGQSSESAKRDFVAALRSLVGLPVWIVVRLYTDENDVVQYWSELDSQLELSLEVLDDFESEAVEVYNVQRQPLVDVRSTLAPNA